MKQVTFSQAVNGYFLFARSRRLSERTINDYKNTYKKFGKFIGDDVFLDEIDSHDIQSFLAEQDKVKKKTLLNYHTGLSALWTWAIREKLAYEHIVQAVPHPKPEKREIIPFTVCWFTASQIKNSRTTTFVFKDLAHKIYRKKYVFEPSCDRFLF